MKKRYKITQDTISYLLKNNTYHFRVGYEKVIDGKKYLYSQKTCPVVGVTAVDIIQTENEFSQNNIKETKNFAGRIVNGQRLSEFYIFEDVTNTTVEGDVTVNLDSLFD